MNAHRDTKWVPDEIVPTPEVRDLRASLRLLRLGRVQGYVACMMDLRPVARFRVETPEDIAEARARYTKTAEAKFPEIGQ